MFTPHSESEVAEMLKVVGLNRLEDLFKAVPESCRFPKLDMPAGLSEMETRFELQLLSESNETAHDLACFLGAGAYNHYIPAAVDAIIRRGSSSPPIRLISLRFPRGHCRPYLSIRV